MIRDAFRILIGWKSVLSNVGIINIIMKKYILPIFTKEIQFLGLHADGYLNY